MLSVFKPSFEVVEEGLILHLVSGNRGFEFADIVYDEKSDEYERILTHGLLFDLYLSLS